MPDETSVRYPALPKPMHLLFAAIRLWRGKTQDYIISEYAGELYVSCAIIRKWLEGNARPHPITGADIIKRLAFDGVTIGHLDVQWLKMFLNALEVSDELRKEIMQAVSLLPKDDVRGNKPVYLRFQDRLALAIEVGDVSQVRAALDALGLAGERPTLQIIGGAKGLSTARQADCMRLLNEAVVPFCEAHGVALLSGGTNIGVARLLGQAYAQANAVVPLIGVAPRMNVRLPGDEENALRDNELEPNHTHFVLCLGSEWHEASRFLNEMAFELSGHRNAVTLLLNGGEYSLHDLLFSFFAGGRPVIAVEGSGRAADVLSAAIRGRTSRPMARWLYEQRAIRCVALGQPAELRAALEDAFSTNTNGLA